MSTPGDPTLQSVRELEDDFAEAMSRMYTVGNDLARLRTRLAREASPQQWTPAPAPGDQTATAPHPQVPHQQQAAPSVPAQPQVPPPAVTQTMTTAPVPAAQAPAPQAAPAAQVPAAQPTAWTAAPGTAGAVTAPPVAHAPFAGAQPPHVPPTGPPQPSTPWWQRDGVVARLLAVVGTGITLIGVAFLLALAIQMGFFGPAARVISGALLAAGLVTAAVIVRRRQASTAGALGLAATGIATAYLDVIAITRIYEWVPVAIGLVIAGLIAIGGLLLARGWDSELLAGITVLGVAVLAPTLAYDHMLLVGEFLLVLTIASWPAQVSRRWHALEVARVAPTAFVIALLTPLGEPVGAVMLLAGLLAGFVLVTSLAGVRIAKAPAQAGIVVPVVAVPVLLAALSAERWAGSALMLALTVALVLVAALTSGRRPQESAKGTDTLYLTECCLYTAGMTSLVSAALIVDWSDWSLPAVLAVSLLWAVAALALRDRRVMGVSLLTSVIPLLLAVTLVPYAIDRGLSTQVDLTHLVAAALTVPLLLVLAKAIAVVHPDTATFATRTLVPTALLGAGGTVVIAGTVLGDALIRQPWAGFTAGQAGATVLWLSTAAVLLLRGLRGSTIAVPAGLAITAFCVGKLLFFDLAFLDGIPRVLSFIVGGLIVLGMGAGYAQALERSRREPEPVDNSGDGPRTPHTV